MNVLADQYAIARLNQIAAVPAGKTRDNNNRKSRIT